MAFPQNNDIIATAEQGNGGKLNITTNAIFGLESRSKETLLNDITASSEFGLDGDVQIRVLDVDPARSLTELPKKIINASRLITKSCLAGDEENEFVLTGIGGLPANPNESLKDTAVLSAEWVSLEPNQNNLLNDIKWFMTSALNKSIQHAIQHSCICVCFLFCCELNKYGFYIMLH